MAQRAGEKSREASISGRPEWNLVLKPGFDLQRILETRDVQPGFCMTASVSRGAGGHRRIALGSDGGRLGGAAAHRQFRLGRHHLDFSVGLVGAGSALWPVAGAAPNARQWLVAALVAIWSLRLGTHIAIRTAGITDDPRYAAFASEWGVNAPRRMFIFLQNQGLGSIPLVFAIFVAARFPGDGLRLSDYLGALILLAGIAGEALADAQLKTFRGDPANKGRVCDVGLWRWSRHPNYFFEWFGWLAYPVIGLSAGLSLGLGDAAGPRLHVLDPGPRHRHPAAGRADAAFARRSLSRLPVAHQRVLSAAAASMILKSRDRFPSRRTRNATCCVPTKWRRAPLTDSCSPLAIVRLAAFPRSQTTCSSPNAQRLIPIAEMEPAHNPVSQEKPPQIQCDSVV